MRWQFWGTVGVLFFAVSLLWPMLLGKRKKKRILDRDDTDDLERKQEEEDDFVNLQFYRNQISSQPRGDTISVIHETWKGDYDRLESHHGYIQWLFPLYEGKGMNYLATGLDKEEAKLMREDMLVGKNVMKSYELMLDFYGMRLFDKTTGEGFYS